MNHRYDLIIEPSGDRARTVPLPEDGTVSIGRHAEATVVLGDPQASRRHSELTCTGDRVWVRDCGSANGTLINGQRITAMVALQPGDAFTIGSTTLRLALATQDATVIPPAQPSTAVLQQPTAVIGDGQATDASTRPAASRGDTGATTTPDAGGSVPVGPGAVLNGRYRLDRVLGRGGFAQVFLATDVMLQRQVAVKVLHSELTEDQGQDFLARFTQEARSVAALDHPNILTIHDYGEAGGTVYLVMPYVDGGTLHDRLRSVKRVVPEAAGRYLRQVAAALDYAHRRHLVHRDIKPQNMLLRDEDDHLLLSDFGIAKVLTGTSAQSRTSVMGTLSYMAPEQFEGIVSPATDIYALGCVLFQLLTGQVPFEGSTEQVIYSHLQKSSPRLAERVGASLPTAIQDVLDRALAKRPDDRYRTAGEFAAAYDAALAGQARAAGPDQVATVVGGAGLGDPNATVVAPVGTNPLPPGDSARTVLGGGPPIDNRGMTPPLGGYPPPGGGFPPPGGGYVPPIVPPGGTTAPPPRGGRRAFIIGAAGVGTLALLAAGGGALFLRSQNSATPTATSAPMQMGSASASGAPSAAASSSAAPSSAAPSSAAASVAPSAAPSQAPPSVAAAASSAPPTVAPAVPTVAAAPTTAPTVAPTVPPAVPTTAPAAPTATRAAVATATSAPASGGFAGRAGQVLQGHSELIEAIAFSPDGRLLASGSDDNTARLWQPNGQSVAVLRGHTADVNGVAWTPDGSLLATSSGDKSIRIWSSSGSLARSLTGHTDVVMASAWFSDSRSLVSGSWDGTLRFWNGATGSAGRVINAHNAKIWALAAFNENQIASGSEDKTVKLWRSDGSLRGTLNGHSDIIWGLAWSPDGSLLASSSKDGTVRLWSNIGQVVGTILRGSQGVSSLAWSPDGKMIACGLYDGRIVVITPNAQVVATCTGHTGYVAGVTWIADSTILASGAQDATIRTWS